MAAAGCQKADMEMIALQIPQHTAASLAKAYRALTWVFEHELNAAKIHMVAAWDDEYAGQIASGRIKVQHADFKAKKQDRCFRKMVF